MKNKTKFSFMAIIVVAAISTGIFAYGSEIAYDKKTVITQGSLHAFSLEDLSQGAQFAIDGKVKDIQSVEVQRDGKILVFSDVTLNVNEDLFGQYDQKEITVRIMGGETPNITHISGDDASFDKNEHVLVFVAGPEPDSIWGNNYYVAGLELGKYKVEDGKAKQSDKEQYDEIELKNKIKKYRADKIN